MLVNDISVIADPALENEEITRLVEEEARAWAQQNKKLGQVELTLEGDQIVIRAFEKSPIRRVRRITGYLSSFDNFNDAKRAECDCRVSHAF